MKPIPEYDSVYHYPVPVLTSIHNYHIHALAADTMPLVVCLDGITVSFISGYDTPAWSHYQDVPPSQALERIERLAHIIATHYPTS